MPLDNKSNCPTPLCQLIIVSLVNLYTTLTCGSGCIEYIALIGLIICYMIKLYLLDRQWGRLPVKTPS